MKNIFWWDVITKYYEIVDFTAASGSGVYIWWGYQKNTEISKKLFNIFKAYLMVYMITKFSDSSFSQFEGKVEGQRFCYPTQNEVQKAHPE